MGIITVAGAGLLAAWALGVLFMFKRQKKSE
jgi:hypothetical protein